MEDDISITSSIINTPMSDSINYDEIDLSDLPENSMVKILRSSNITSSLNKK